MIKLRVIINYSKDTPIQIVYEQSFGSYESGLVIDNEHFYTSECQLNTKDEFLSSSITINQVLIEDAIKLLQ